MHQCTCHMTTFRPVRPKSLKSSDLFCWDHEAAQTSHSASHLVANSSKDMVSFFEYLCFWLPYELVKKWRFWPTVPVCTVQSHKTLTSKLLWASNWPPSLLPYPLVLQRVCIRKFNKLYTAHNFINYRTIKNSIPNSFNKDCRYTQVMTSHHFMGI